MKRYLDLILSTALSLIIIVSVFVVWWQHPAMTEMQVFQYMLSNYWLPLLFAILLQILFLRKVGRGK